MSFAWTHFPHMHSRCLTGHVRCWLLTAFAMLVLSTGLCARAEDATTMPLRTAATQNATPESLRLPAMLTKSEPPARVGTPGMRQPTSESLPSPLTDATSATLSLSDLEQMALQNNPTLPASSAAVSAARGRQVQSGLYPNPSLGYFSDDVGVNDTAGKQGGYVMQEFVTGGKLRLNRAIGGQEVQEFQFRRDAQELRVLSDVRLRFYNALVAQRRVELSDELLKYAGQSRDVSQRLLQAQQVSQSDLLQAEIEANEAQILSNNARNIKTEARSRLAAVIGVPDLDERPLVGDLEHNIPSYEREETYSRILAANPQLSAAQARVQRARIAIERSRREIIPNITTFASVSHLTENGDTLLGVQVGGPIPVFNRNQGNIMQANAELVASENEVRRVELELRDRLSVAYRRYANASQQVDRYQTDILPRAKQSIDLVSRGYGAGQLDFLALLTSQRTYIRVNLTYLDALAELREAATLIQGQLLSDSLQTENPQTQAGSQSMK